MTKDITKEPTTWILFAYNSTPEDQISHLRTFTGTVDDAEYIVADFIKKTEGMFGPFDESYNPIPVDEYDIHDLYDGERIVYHMLGENSNYCEDVITYIATPMDEIDEFKGEL